MSERPILFSGEMVRAILDGRKTQTRRVMKPQPDRVSDVPGLEALCFKTSHGVYHCLSGPPLYARCPYGQPGDRLWVRETFSTFTGEEGTSGVLYRSDPMYDTTKPGDFGWDWKPSIHMPRWASRLTLEVTEVRVQRVQEISEDDAFAEGLVGDSAMVVKHYRSLWDSLNTKRGYSWESNSWVWAITFTVGAPSRGPGEHE